MIHITKSNKTEQTQNSFSIRKVQLHKNKSGKSLYRYHPDLFDYKLLFQLSCFFLYCINHCWCWNWVGIIKAHFNTVKIVVLIFNDKMFIWPEKRYTRWMFCNSVAYSCNLEWNRWSVIFEIIYTLNTSIENFARIMLRSWYLRSFG